MNINSKKLLPQSKNSDTQQKISADKFLVPVKNIQYKNIVKLSERKDEQKQKFGKSGLRDDILSIKESVLSIEKILSKTIQLQKDQATKDRIQKENQRRLEKEEKFEKKKDYGFKILKNIPKPKLGIVDWIKKFILNVFLGYLAVRAVDYLPTLISIASKITPAINFIGWMGKNLLKGLINFIDWGYKAYDSTKGFVKQLGGSGAEKVFDEFSKNLNDVLNYTIIAALGVAALANKVKDKHPDGKRKQLRDPRTNKPIPTDKKGNYSFNRSGSAYQREVFRKTDWSNAQYNANENKIMRRYAERYGRDAAIDKFGKESVKDLGGKYGRSRLTNAARSGAVKLVGKSGAKTVLKFTRPLLKRLPIIGGLIDFGLSLAMGEPLGRAAFSAIGAALLGTIGTGFGGPIGAIIGGFAGDWAGGKLYDILFKGKKEQAKDRKVKGKAQGGIITPTRGGSAVGGSIGRTLKVKRTTPKQPKLQAPKTDPGKNIGGEKVISKVFSKENPNTLDQVSPLRSLKTTSSILKSGQSTLLSQTMAVGVDLAMGQKPTKAFYSKYGKAFGSFIQELVNTNMEVTTQDTAKSILAMATGGIVPPNMPSRGPNFGAKVGEILANTFSNLVEKQAASILTALREESNKKPISGNVPGGQTTPDGEVDVQGGTSDFWTLVAVASREDGDPQAWADVAQSIYNRLGSGAYSGKSIKDLILGQMQYEPTWKFPKPGTTGVPNPEWRNITDAQSASAASGQSPDAMKKVASALLDPTLQKNAREFIQGRTDFRGYSVSGGVQRKGGDNYFGWYNNYRDNKVASVPNFGATASGRGGGSGPNIQLGSGYGSAGSKIAGELGRFIKQKLRSPAQFQAVTEHPEHGGVRGRHADGSFHYSNRAIDIGAYTHEQGPILRVISEFNKLKGVRPVELLHGNNDAGHRDHVHVAYKHGGLVTKPTHALIGETKKPEMVLDPDTTGTMNKEYPGMLAKLNAAKNKKQISEVLSSYASYENNNNPTLILIPVEKIVNNTVSKQSPPGPPRFGSTFTSDALNIETLLA
jgi:hypothetical protein